MRLTAPFRHLARNVEFARHMPLAKMLRRAQLHLHRSIDDLLPSRRSGSRGAPAPARSAAPPQPVFAPRKTGAIGYEAARLRLTFLNRTVTMPSPRIDWSASPEGAAHQLWRMNLHYMEYLEEVDDAGFEALTAQWLDENATPSARAWRDSWNSYALSIRVVVWLQELARRAGRIDGVLVRRIEASAAEQLRFLTCNLETDLCGNHLIKNIKALVWGGGYFTGGEAEVWRRCGLELLRTALAEQILPDGMHCERSPSYHAQVFSDLLECRHVLGGDALAGALDDALARMAQVVADLAHPDGGPALFNDAGLTMAYAPAACLAAYARLTGAEVLARRTFALRSAGYFGCRDASSYLVADCGRIAPDDLPAHGHGDVLSFEWSVKAHRVIVDQGVYEYIAGERRSRSRAAASHNTLALAGADQAQFFGAFRCGRRPNVEVRRYESRDDGFVLEGSHDGYASLPGRPRHVRRFDVHAGRVEISDRIEGWCERPASVGFLLHPGVRVAANGNTVLLAVAPGIDVRLTSSHEPTVEPAVWWPDMGHEIATSRIVVRLPRDAREARTFLELV